MSSEYDRRYPIWKCPDCKRLNRYAATFMEICIGCGEDHTTDWDEYVVEVESDANTAELVEGVPECH